MDAANIVASSPPSMYEPRDHAIESKVGQIRVQPCPVHHHGSKGWVVVSGWCCGGYGGQMTAPLWLRLTWGYPSSISYLVRAEAAMVPVWRGVHVRQGGGIWPLKPSLNMPLYLGTSLHPLAPAV